jgi:hypothetical protein
VENNKIDLCVQALKEWPLSVSLMQSVIIMLKKTKRKIRSLINICVASLIGGNTITLLSKYSAPNVKKDSETGHKPLKKTGNV